jgi:hypothetical protein
MKRLLAFFYNHLEFLYLNPLYRISDSSTTGSATDRASLTLTGETLTITLTNDHEVIRCSVAPTKFPGQRNWFWMSLLRQFLDGGEETIVSPADNASWFRDNFSRIEALFADDVVSRSIEEISTLRRENAVKEFGQPT